MKNPSHNPPIRITDQITNPAGKAGWLAAVLGLASALGLQATVLDDFNSTTRTGWTDTPNGGHLVQSGGQLEVTTAGSASALTYGTKTSQGFANAANQTLEFRVDVNAVSPGSGNPNPGAILAWLPSGAVPGSGSSGYSLWVTAGAATLKKGSTTLATSNYTAAATNNQNTTLVLRMTPAGSSITVNARVYRQTGSLPMQNFTEIWETTQTVTDSVGTSGYAALGASSGAATTAATVYFDNLQVFQLQDTVLDDFSGGTADLANYSISGYPAKATISGGTFELATPTYNNTIYAAARRTSPNYQITDGSRLEFAVDIVDNATGPLDPYAVAVLGYTPFNSDVGIGGLVAYHVGPGCYALYMGKCYAQWWVNGEPFPSYANTGNPVPGSNVRLILSLTGEGTSVRIDSRVEDMSVGVNDPARLLYQNVFVDSPAVDPLDTANTPNTPDGTSLPFGPAPYLNQPGSVVLISFFGGNSTDVSDITYDNLTVNQTAPANLPPAINKILPPDRSNFVATASSQVSFQVTDDANIPAGNISLTLNGVTYADGSGAAVAGTTTSKTFTLNNPLAPDTFYSGSIQATDNVGAVTVQAYSFDTFRASTCYVVESEDYNYGGGQSIEPYNTLLNAYIGLNGVEGVDFHDNRTSMDAGNSVYRQDPVQNNITADGPRSKYVDGTPPGEVVLVDRQNGDWNNYTHVYPAGWYSVYLRMSQYILPNSVIELDRVTGDITQPDQTTVPLGSFLSAATGYDINHNVPLTDAFGHPLLIQCSGAVDTLRINNISVQTSSSELWQNYLVLVPASAPGALPPFVASVSPPPGSVVGSSGTPNYSATIANRSSTVDASSIIFLINGAVVAANTTPFAGGATVTWTPVGTTATFTNTLIFKDNLNAWQTNTWTYAYGAVLRATNSLPIGSLTVPGFNARMAQSYNPGDPAYANIGVSGGLPNGVASAQALLAIPPQYTMNETATSIVQLVAWDINPANFHYGAVTNFPGMCLPPGNVNSFAVETVAYLQLTAGAHRFYVDSDDAVAVYSGASLTDTATVLVLNDAVTHTAFDFLVEADGLYPFHIVFEQGGGDAYLVLKSVNLNDNSQTLINAAGGISAFYADPDWVCMSATSATGPYTAVSVPVSPTVTTTPVPCDGTGEALNLAPAVTGGTITIPNITSSAQFYRVAGPRSSRITSAKKFGSSLIITFQTP